MLLFWRYLLTWYIYILTCALANAGSAVNVPPPIAPLEDNEITTPLPEVEEPKKIQPEEIADAPTEVPYPLSLIFYWVQIYNILRPLLVFLSFSFPCIYVDKKKKLNICQTKN